MRGVAYWILFEMKKSESTARLQDDWGSIRTTQTLLISLYSPKGFPSTYSLTSVKLQHRRNYKPPQIGLERVHVTSTIFRMLKSYISAQCPKETQERKFGYMATMQLDWSARTSILRG